MKTSKETAELNAQIGRLRAIRTFVATVSMVISVLVTVVGLKVANEGHSDLLSQCLLFHVINIISSNRVLSKLQKEIVQLLTQLGEQEGDNNE